MRLWLFGLILLVSGTVGVAQSPSGNPHARLPDDPAVCSACHKPESLGDHWLGSAHQMAEVPCTGCHRDLASLTPETRQSWQASVCLDCHTRVRGEFQRPFSHPVRTGQMACTDCHQPHGGPGIALLIHETVNDQCYQCHAEKRGPFLWEHAPVTDNCANCHQPHGSSHRAQLQARPVFLCKQCHMAAYHPSNAESGTGLPPEGASAYLLGQECTNCHSQVHGSNHPSGSGLTR